MLIPSKIDRNLISNNMRNEYFSNHLRKMKEIEQNSNSRYNKEISA